MEVQAISALQMRCIYAIARSGGMDSEALHAVVEDQTGKASIKGLTKQEANRVIDRLKRLTGQEGTHEPDRASAEQVAKVRALEARLGWRDNPQRLTAFLEGRYHVSYPTFLRSTDARNCIEAMKAMLAGGRGERRPS